MNHIVMIIELDEREPRFTGAFFCSSMKVLIPPWASACTTSCCLIDR